MKKRFIVFLVIMTYWIGSWNFVLASEEKNSFKPLFLQTFFENPALMGKILCLSQKLLKERNRSLKHYHWLLLHKNLQDRAWAIYRKRMMSSRGGYVNGHFILMEATAYDPGPDSCGPQATGRTFTGMHAGYGIAAVDPRVIPLGTHLYVEGYGYAIAADIGSAIKGYRIDLCFPTREEALRFGRRKVRVYILSQ
jgi:3D (Asp-Asp-Asp) domain-containing protein